MYSARVLVKAFLPLYYTRIGTYYVATRTFVPKCYHAHAELTVLHINSAAPSGFEDVF